ncbi:CRP/FNR family transcriptional regulator, anaerobic regulatory protein [Paenibacillus sp. UNC496MF]|uniref:Crp/Fnr family transcriptional regulator n=1 Tax=Paenibacillus sp. UNC496MF TaxID=1502753 RepID=UPI0008F3574D|nr:Crp/Fnr family transcriptional regulator [Paenibacillus sp. UNC496MF]SFI31145.1 CRP/FNR family transcriptional regulator, anaerobic regulatory protein [Paenibacillus sp. UNC496MF]
MKPDKTKFLLSRIKIFESLSTEVVRELEQITNESSVITLPKSSIIQTPGSEKKGLFFVIEGKLRFYKTNPAGKQYTVCILSEGGIFGESESFSLATSGTYVETMEESTIYSIPAEQIEPLLSKHSELTLRFLAEMSKRLKIQDELVEKMVFRDLRGKVLYFLNRLSIKFGVEENGYRKIDIPLTHQELANMIGATREAVSLTLQELTNEGILITSRKTVMIDIQKLTEELS